MLTRRIVIKAGLTLSLASPRSGRADSKPIVVMTSYYG